MKTLLIVTTLLASISAFAEEMPTSTMRDTTYTDRRLRDEAFGIKPQVGAFAFNTSATDPEVSDSTTRATYGATMDFNLNAWRSVGYTGFSTGLFFSKTGAPGANFWGSGGALDIDSHVLIVPANLKLGWNVSDSVRFSVHGGANVMYRSNIFAVQVGEFNTDKWSFYPNVGADLEFALGRNIGIILRPDLTLTPGRDFGTVTAGLNIFG
jgi:hypothetical protein